MIMKDMLTRLLARLTALRLETMLVLSACVLVVLLAVEGVQWRSVGRIERTVAESLEQGARVPQERAAVADLKAYDAVVARGMLGKAPGRPAQKLWGIIGEMALVGASSAGARPYKVGAKIPSGEKVVSIGINDVVLEKDGKRRTEQVFREMKRPARPGPRPGATKAAPKSGPTPSIDLPPRANKRPAVEVGAESEDAKRKALNGEEHNR